MCLLRHSCFRQLFGDRHGYRCFLETDWRHKPVHRQPRYRRLPRLFLRRSLPGWFTKNTWHIIYAYDVINCILPSCTKARTRTIGSSRIMSVASSSTATTPSSWRPSSLSSPWVWRGEGACDVTATPQSHDVCLLQILCNLLPNESAVRKHFASSSHYHLFSVGICIGSRVARRRASGQHSCHSLWRHRHQRNDAILFCRRKARTGATSGESIRITTLTDPSWSTCAWWQSSFRASSWGTPTSEPHRSWWRASKRWRRCRTKTSECEKNGNDYVITSCEHLLLLL